jgi:uncharacterized membrane protein
MKENSRIEAFSDGVFAIAITLLVLELKVPPATSVHSISDLWNGLIHLWPSYFAFTLSFGILLVSWVNHHYLFNILDKSSRPFLYANGFLLFTITFMPFPTALLAEYISTDYAKPAIAFYCFGGVINSIGWNLLLHTIIKPQKLVRSDESIKQVHTIKRSTQVGFLIYSVATIMAFWFPIIALIMNLLLWLVWISLSITTKESFNSSVKRQTY